MTTCLPASLPPRLRTKEQAAEYVALSPTTFAEVVAAGVLPRPIRLAKRRIAWDRVAIDAAIDRLSGIVRPSTPEQQVMELIRRSRERTIP